MRDFIYEYNQKYGATIILTSHNMDDLTNLARRVIVIDEGRILFDGALEDLASRFAKEKIIKVLSEVGINPTNRPQNLSLDDIIHISLLL